MNIVPFVPQHLDDISLQPGQSEMAQFIGSPGYGEMLADLPGSYSLFKNGTFLGCGGLAPQAQGKALAWCLIGTKLEGVDMIPATKIVRRQIAASGFRRIEAIVKEGFDQGFRWIKLLGFKCETPDGMLNWFEDGTRGYLFARVGK